MRPASDALRAVRRLLATKTSRNRTGGVSQTAPVPSGGRGGGRTGLGSPHVLALPIAAALLAAASLSTSGRPAVAPAAAQPAVQSTLLGRYETTGYAAEYQQHVYRPRQFTPGLVFHDPNWGPETVADAGAYAGWDVFFACTAGHCRAEARDPWLTLTLTRPAQVAVVWRAPTEPPSWLSSWAAGGTVTSEGPPYPVYVKDAPAGDVRLGAVFDPGRSGTPRDAYWVLLGEQGGAPSAAPAVPAGREAPRPNQTCPAWVHDQYVAPGPDGKSYATWHPQIDPVHWCYFRHEHGSDPKLFPVAGYQPLYDYANAKGGHSEPHQGFKGYAFTSGGHHWYLTHHFGTSSPARACARFHEVHIAVARQSDKRLVADLHLQGDHGQATDHGGRPLTPSACPDQARQAAAEGSTGVRKLPTAGAVAYEPWQLDFQRTILGLRGTLGFNTPDVVTQCANLTCDPPGIATGGKGASRFFTPSYDFGIVAGSNTGTFYTNARGTVHTTAADPLAVRQYVDPQTNARYAYLGDSATCRTGPGAWNNFQAGYRCVANTLQGNSIELERSLRSPN